MECLRVLAVANQFQTTKLYDLKGPDILDKKKLHVGTQDF